MRILGKKKDWKSICQSTKAVRKEPQAGCLSGGGGKTKDSHRN